MPVITLYLPPDNSGGSAEVDIQQLQQDCHYLCIQLLDAAPVNIQIQVVTTCKIPLGRVVYADVKYRHQTHRDGELMALFMQQPEGTLVRHCRAPAPRIRCFPFTPEQLYARN
ncbi:hypothetical protein ACG0Z5_17545 [Scandinavium sp. M-37]|uniref:hypothetical protein n=1 Tax=Scandinavium sp. M-37 TaxID=3373077 RepID=UPI0037464CD0